MPPMEPLLSSTPPLAHIANATSNLTSPRKHTGRKNIFEDISIMKCAVGLLVLAFNATYAVLVYGVVRSSSESMYRGYCHRTLSGFKACQVFMPILGAMAGFSDLAIIIHYVKVIPHDTWPKRCLGLAGFFGYIFTLGVAILIVALGWIVTAVVSRSTYAHACDLDWLEIVMTAHTWKTAATRNVATFSLVEPREALWTWTSNDPFQNDFNLVGLNSTNPSLLPSLSNVTINHATNELERAWCHGTTNQCATGYVWPFDGLSFEVQFNGTLTRMRNVHREWSFAHVPSVSLHRVDENGQLAERLMETSIQKPGACRQIKVCVSHAMRRQKGVVDPDVLVAAYWLLHKQAISSRKCTAERVKKVGAK